MLRAPDAVQISCAVREPGPIAGAHGPLFCGAPPALRSRLGERGRNRLTWRAELLRQTRVRGKAGKAAFPTCRCRKQGYIAPIAVSSPDLKAFLLATPFFGGLSDASLDLLISMLAKRSFDASTTIFSEGEPGRSMFIVHSGELVVSKLGDCGRSIRMTDLGPGDFFGEMTLIEMQNRSATVVAETDTVLYELTARNLYASTRPISMPMYWCCRISTANSAGVSAAPTVVLPS